jgi:hypothetical protein
MDDHRERTVGVFRWVLDNTISKKSAAVGTGAIVFRPLVDIDANEVRVDGQRLRCVWDQNFGLKDIPTVGDLIIAILRFMEWKEYNNDSKERLK